MKVGLPCVAFGAPPATLPDKVMTLLEALGVPHLWDTRLSPLLVAGHPHRDTCAPAPDAGRPTIAVNELVLAEVPLVCALLAGKLLGPLSRGPFNNPLR